MQCYHVNQILVLIDKNIMQGAQKMSQQLCFRQLNQTLKNTKMYYVC